MLRIEEQSYAPDALHGALLALRVISCRFHHHDFAALSDSVFEMGCSLCPPPFKASAVQVLESALRTFTRFFVNHTLRRSVLHTLAANWSIADFQLHAALDDLFTALFRSASDLMAHAFAAFFDEITGELAADPCVCALVLNFWNELQK
jgi:hypothetical protein